MGLDRRSLLKSLAGAGAAVTVAPNVARGSGGGAPEFPREQMVGMLYDATLCVGCKTCMVACREANGIAYEDGETLWDAPVDLSAQAKNIIKLYQEDGGGSCFMKMQCMHCIDPACVSACMLGSLQKREGGAVTWDPDLCVGCRYCQIACPFNVPKFEWDSATPRIVKCELCAHRLAEGNIPACCEVCPVNAVIFGKRDELLAEAKRRIASEPDRYNPRVYGETEGGGTQVLYLAPAGVPFTALGLPDLGEASPPSYVRGVQGLVYRWFAAPVALYAVLGTVIYRNHKRGEAVAGTADAPESNENE